MVSTLAFFLLYEFVFKKLIHIIFPRPKNIPTSQDFYLIKEVFRKPRFFLDKGSFPQAKIFPKEDFFLIEQVFQKAIWPVWLNGLVLVYKLSGCDFESLCCHQYFPLIKEVFHKPRFYHKKRFFLDQKSFPQAKIFPQEMILS